MRELELYLWCNGLLICDKLCCLVIDLLSRGAMIRIYLQHRMQKCDAFIGILRLRLKLILSIYLCQFLTVFEGRLVIHEGKHYASKCPDINFRIDFVSSEEIQLFRSAIDGCGHLFDLLSYSFSITHRKPLVILLGRAAAEIADLPLRVGAEENVLKFEVTMGD